MNILHDLNEKQVEAVIHNNGPVLVIAGPGTGKTKVITHRIAYLIRQHGIKPESILAITFTNKAAQEMRERVNNEIGEPHGSNIKVNTFHAFCVKVLREHAHHIGLSENFAIFDQEIQDEILLEVVNELNLNSDNYPPWRLRNIISDAKCKLGNETDDLFIDPDVLVEIDDPDVEMNVKNAFTTYQHKLAEYNALDFDDLLIKTVTLFEQVSEVQQEYHQQISHILVDEYHDVNRVQYRLLQLLCAAREHNLMVVADADQSIYSWRGSNPQYIKNFLDDFTPQTVELDEHYRCSETILRAAEEVIAKNPVRQKQHTLITHKDEGRNIFHYTFTTPTEEARSIIKIIRNLVKQRNFSYRDIAIFYRTHRLADVLEEELLRTGIEFQRIRATNSFDDENLKGILSYLCFVQWQLRRDLEYAINFPEKRIDDLTWVRLKWLAQRKELTLAELLKNIEDYPEDVGPLTRRNIRRFWEQFEALVDDIEAETIDKIVQKLFARLELFRSPYRAKELSVIENQADMSNLGLAQDVLYSALDRGQPIQITASYGIDAYCAAYIIRETLKTYLNQNVQIQFLPKELKSEDQESQPKSAIGSDQILNENTVNLLIGDFGELGKMGTETRTILIGTTTSGQSDVIQLGSNTVQSITALKLCQRLLSRFETPNMADMVIYDLETTGINPKNANIVEIAAKRLNVIGNEIESFERLVKPPGGYIPPAVTRVHGISTEDVKDEPSIEIVLPEFCSFIQDRILIGHNVARYDNPILERDLQDYLKINLTNPYYDTLVTARKLLPRQRRGIDALAEKFGIEHGRLHRAMEDVETNRQIFKELIRIDLQKREVKSLTEFLPLVGVGILSKTDVPDKRDTLTEISAFLNAAKRFVKAHHSTLPDDLPFDFTEKEQAEEFINQLQQSDVPIFREDTEWIEARSKFRNLLLKFDKVSDGKSLSDFLDYQKLLTNFDELDDKTEQITLMTLHAAKGTEFPVVIIIGMEEGSFPMWKRDITQEEIEEERRLFYVGMTRAQDQLYLSSTIYRYGDRERSASMFIYEMPPDYMIKWSPHSGL
ncbi:UvrD-helicase domain-containing protein [Candidatus Poribacteria bacterium]|nr:UvrD-helicase domain-containing protein [Candidatus Poribacteria bacterium]